MGYKDELSIILDHNIKDLASIQDDIIREQASTIEGLNKEIERLTANSKFN
jgi:hypothetical protein